MREHVQEQLFEDDCSLSERGNNEGEGIYACPRKPLLWILVHDSCDCFAALLVATVFL